MGAWALAKVQEQDEQLFKALATKLERRMDEFNALGHANSLDKFSAQNLANTA